MSARICIVSSDTAFARSIGSRLEGWGLSVAVESDCERVTPSLVDAERVDVVLLAVGRQGDGPLRWLSSVKRALPALEVILLNLAGEIRVSIEGMRAGASHELSAPLDLAKLRGAVGEAVRRRRRRAARARPSLAKRLERAMAAVAFAEAGEAAAARRLLDDDEEGT